MSPFRHPVLSAILFVAAVLSGCGRSNLEMSRTAGYVGAQPGKIYLAPIEGKDADKFLKQLHEALSNDGHFATEPYGVGSPPNPDSTGKTPSIILSGIHSSNDITKFFTEGWGKTEKKYKQRIESHEFQYSIKDAVTGEELESNVIRQENPGEKEEDKGFLDTVLGDAVKGLIEDVVGVESVHRKVLIRDFVAALRLHPERRVIGLLEDDEIPELEEGIKSARKGNWGGAIAAFQAGAEGHPKSAALHKAYFNLGVAFEYNHDFDKALASLRLADELAPQQGYGAEYDYCKSFARQYRWQQRYAGSSSEAFR